MFNTKLLAQNTYLLIAAIRPCRRRASAGHNKPHHRSRPRPSSSGFTCSIACGRIALNERRLTPGASGPGSLSIPGYH